MDRALAGAVPYLRDAARGQVKNIMTPEQRRRNRIAGIILAIIVIAIFAWTFVRGSALMN
ncbi:hypothetical protein CSC67_02935 [Pusillimonas caeni]|nr:hypothetical protein CSC67_02935 [Pusillimonas caeni]